MIDECSVFATDIFEYGSIASSGVAAKYAANFAHLVRTWEGCWWLACMVQQLKSHAFSVKSHTHSHSKTSHLFTPSLFSQVQLLGSFRLPSASPSWSDAEGTSAKFTA